MRAPLWLFLTISVAFEMPLHPQTLSSITPAAATAGGPGFQLTASGAGFVTGAAIQWNGSSLSTTYVNAYTLTAYVPAGLIASPGTAAVTVLNNGHQSGPLPFPIVSFQGPIITSIAPENGLSQAAKQAVELELSGSVSLLERFEELAAEDFAEDRFWKKEAFVSRAHPMGVIAG
jgi:hypothetical protein